MLQVKVIQNMSEVDRDKWDALVGDGSPFLEWDWLACLEEARCVTSRSGWQPQHLTVYDGGRLIAACPLYLKGHSMGEFVFDHSWVEAAHRAGIEYYPKLLVAPPFTPATGVRFLNAPEGDRPALIRLLGQTLQEVCKQNGLSSLHTSCRVCPRRRINAGRSPSGAVRNRTPVAGVNGAATRSLG